MGCAVENQQLGPSSSRSIQNGQDAGMRSWIMDESPGSYRFGDIELPALAADDVRVKVVASALNHMDLWMMRGAPKPPLPHVPGCDVTGIVSEVGREVTTVIVGDEVVVNPSVTSAADAIKFGNNSPLAPSFAIWGEHTWGGHGQYATAPERNVLPRPQSRTWEECAAYPLAHLTAYRMLKRARVQAGERVLIVGIGSGVSCAALALANFMGCEVHVTSRSEAKRAEGLRMGAVVAHDSAAAKWNVEADVVIESVGPATWEQSIKALVPGGRLVLCGSTSGPKVDISLSRLFFKQYELIGSSMGSYQEFAELTRLIDRGVAIHVDSVLDIADYPTALERLEAGDQLGKIVLRH
jgi:zinc-binding alcohol dehydrogenase/oxidoreductase